MALDSALHVRQLHHRYGPEVHAVRGLDLDVARGECFGLLGPNGAGKTTTIEILEGLLTPTSGEVRVLGLDWRTHGDDLRAKLGITLQQTNLPERLSVLETLQMFRSLYPCGRSVDDVLALVSLQDKRGAWYEHLSGGQKQRLAVACALVGDPELLFLDEPTTGLDPQSRRQLWEVVAEFKAQGKTVLLTTHYMDEAERLCDRVAIVDHGQVIALGTPAALIAQYIGQEVVDFAVDGELHQTSLAALPGVVSARALTDGWQLTVSAVHVSVPALLAHVQGRTLRRLSTHQATLEDVFVHLTGRHLRD